MKKRRLLSIVISLCMVLMLCPLTAFAETPSETYSLTLKFKYGTLYDQSGAYVAETNMASGQDYDVSELVDEITGYEPYKIVDCRSSEGDTEQGTFTDHNIILEVIFEADGSLAITVDGFEVGKTPNDCTYTVESTIPGVTFSGTDILRDAWTEYIFDGNDYSWVSMGHTEAFRADTAYRLTISLNNKGLELAPAATVNGIEPLLCWLPTFGDVPYAIQIGCDFGTPAEQSQYTITYEGGEGVEGSIEAGTKAQGKAFTLSSDTFTREGYIQTGWVDEENNNEYSLGDTYTEDADVTLYPIWDEIITLEVPFTIKVKQEGNVSPGETTFDLAVVGAKADEENYRNVTVTGSVTTNGAGDYNGKMTFNGPTRQLRDMLCEGAFVQQVNAGEDGWTYDDTVWGLVWQDGVAALAAADDAATEYSVDIYPAKYEKSDDGIVCSIIEGETPVDKMKFINKHALFATGFEGDADSSAEDSAKTGDNANLTLWITLMLLSVAGIAGTAVYTRRKRTNE